MSPELCGCGLRGERDRARAVRAGAAVSCALRRAGLRPSSQCSLLTLWRRGIAERSGRALDAVPPVRVRAVGFDGVLLESVFRSLTRRAHRFV